MSVSWHEADVALNVQNVGFLPLAPVGWAPSGMHVELDTIPSPKPETGRSGDLMKLEGGCYCRKLRYLAEGEPTLRAQCHCRECQYISGGSPNMFLLMPPEGFSYTKGTPKRFTRSDLDRAVTREFCGECGTHILTRRPGLPSLIVKAGTLDDPSAFGAPEMAIFTVDKQAFHQIPEGLPTFERLPKR